MSISIKDEGIILDIPIEKAFENIDLRFKKCVRSDNVVIQEMIDYVFAKKGKRFRPALVFISSEIWNSPNYMKIIDLALSIELIHIATLVHDDVIDKSEIRRGIETYNKKWGGTASVLFGDFLYSRAFVILARLGYLKIIQFLSKTTSEICEGEIMQNFFKNDFEISVEKYLTIIGYKTASLIAESCRVGAVISEMGVDIEEKLYKIGYNLGMAFQIYDDYLDYDSSEKVLGKPVLSDISNGYITLPVIHLLSQVSNGSKEQFFSKRFNSKELSSLKDLKALLKKHNSLEYTLEIAKDYIQKATAEIESLENKRLKNHLAKIVSSVVTRKF